ncbi:ovarian-specific serine/threonine-protein kinase Lok isoform X2 [Wyeomyia smithii]|uniref:ovarian-specific serine/threonine-protein kinase Lok isoform X2 n=1 Tax=Wyeomyia smithii TaxID=174621 RepID=UPI002467C582|nr:ovarian-specific serine/threonine-protein kinase Lok isoform X2 [Wyeomyia smithii]
MSQEVDTVFTTQTQHSEDMSQFESQPMEALIWGRLYAKNMTITTLDLRKETYSAGRKETNDLCINTEHVPLKIIRGISSLHFTIRKNLADKEAPAYIKDHSRNGTFINGTLIGQGKEFILKDDDVISLSHQSFKAIVYKDQRVSKHLTELPEEIRQTYYVGHELGSGACGTVYLIHNAITCEAFAMKLVKKNLLNECSKPTILNEPQRIMNEVKIMKSLKHPCVIKMHDIVNTPESVYMVLEYMKGGDLLSRIIRNKRLQEKTAKIFFLQMCHAVKYLHEKGITHRDLKPDNILLEKEDEITLLKVSDFGLSKFVEQDSVMRTICGTILFVAPEVLATGGIGSYTKKVDIWSLGVVLFTMLSGKMPFSDSYGTPAVEQIKRARFNFSDESWKPISSAAKNLIYKILTVDPKNRPTLDEILGSAWLRDRDAVAQVERLIKKKLTGTKKPGKCTSDIENNNDHVFIEPPKKRPRNN